MIHFNEEEFDFEIVDYGEPEVLINPHPIVKPYTPLIPPLKQPKKEKIKRIYEDDDCIIDLFVEEKMVRVSVFDNGHFKDEIFVKKDEYYE